MTALSNINGAAIVAAARSFVGIPFRHQGRDPETGLDCRGLLFAICAKLGHQPRHQHRDDYARDPDPKEFRAGLESELDLIWEGPTSDLRPPTSVFPGDVFLIRFPRATPEEATHCGVLADGLYEPMLIHSFCNGYAGAVIEEPLRRWQEYLVAAFRFPGVAPSPLGRGTA